MGRESYEAQFLKPYTKRRQAVLLDNASLMQKFQ
jgi:hypothetical protein